MTSQRPRERRPPSFGRRLRDVQAAIVPEVGELIDAHPGTISLGQGMVAYGPPPAARERLAGFFDDSLNHAYGPVPGHPDLIGAIEEKLRRENQITVDDRQRVLVTAGSNMAFFQAVLAITDPGDEIVLLDPFYFNHEMAVRIADCNPVTVPTDEGYQPILPAIHEAIGPRTRAVVTVSPNNPSGAVYPREILVDVNRLCRDRGLFHISDEAYEYFTYGDAEHVSPASFADAADHTISLFSLSKAYGFAGWRIGYSAVPAALEDPLMKIQDTNLICPSNVSQIAALGALETGREYCLRHLDRLAEVRELVLEALEGLGFRCRRPLVADGAFYVLLELASKLPGRELNAHLIRDFGVAALPGETFGIEDRCALRVSYGALDRDTVAEGIGRLVRGLRAIVGG